MVFSFLIFSIIQNVSFAADSRFDLYQVNNPRVLALADSTVALVHNSKIMFEGERRASFLSDNLGARFNLCSSEPFRDQESVAFCSGSLVAPDKILTAGHCVNSQADCDGLSVVFGFAVNNGPAGSLYVSMRTVNAAEIYQCAGIIHGEDQNSGADFALIQLARPVENHLPLAYRESGSVASGQRLVMIGHPLGLPTKVAGGKVLDGSPQAYFVTDLDTYEGNSGSAVFNADTGLIEGVYSRGGQDLVYKNSCLVSEVCGSGERPGRCEGEDVTRISEVIPYLEPETGTQIQPAVESEVEEELTLSENPAADVGVLHRENTPCAHSLSNLNALCNF